MRLTAPAFWYAPPGAAAGILQPLTPLYDAARRLRRRITHPYKASVPVICVGNLTVGGGGKTPAAIALMNVIRAANPSLRPCFLTRGYGGTLKGPVLIDPRLHDSRLAGDEPLLLIRTAPVIVAANRGAGAKYAQSHGFDLIVMDDGLQNPALHQDVKCVAIDAASGFGNGMTLPAGPLREPLGEGLARADAFIVTGTAPGPALPPEKPAFRATLTVRPGAVPPQGGQPFIAFCGIARPEKFRDTLREQGLDIAAFHAFPDHCRFTAADLARLTKEAEEKKARLITTEKDAVRLPAGFKTAILPVELAWNDTAALLTFLKERIPAL